MLRQVVVLRDISFLFANVRGKLLSVLIDLLVSAHKRALWCSLSLRKWCLSSFFVGFQGVFVLRS